MKITNLKPGMVVYDVGKYRMGNTKVNTVGVWTVKIISIEAERGIVFARWNSNAEKAYYRRSWSKWRKKKPILITGPFGVQRLATREEIQAEKTKLQEEVSHERSE